MKTNKTAFWLVIGLVSLAMVGTNCHESSAQDFKDPVVPAIDAVAGALPAGSQTLFQWGLAIYVSADPAAPGRKAREIVVVGSKVKDVQGWRSIFDDLEWNPNVVFAAIAIPNLLEARKGANE